MEFLLFLIVFVINYNNGMARPMTDSDVEILTRNGINSEGQGNVDNGIFNLPMVLKPRMRITISGELHTKDPSFKIILRDGNETEKDCNISYDYASSTLKVTSIYGNPSEPYKIAPQNSDYLKFSLIIFIRSEEEIALIFGEEDTGTSNILNHEIGNLKNIKSIVMQEGVANVDSLSFEFLHP